MTPAETLRIAVAGIAANKLRSGLTILGMTIGVAAVIVLVAVGNGSKQQVQAGIDALGSNVLIVQAQNGPGGPGGFRFGGGGGLTLTHPDATALAGRVQRARREDRGARWSTPRGRRWSRVRRATQPSSVVGSTPAYATTRDYQVAAGSMFTGPGRQEAPARGDPRPDRRIEPVRRPGPGRPVGAHRRHELRGHRRDQAEGLQRRPGPGRRRDRAASPPCRTRSAATARSATSPCRVASTATLDAAQAEVTVDPRAAPPRHRHRRTPASRSSTRARCARRPTRAPRSSPRCSARSPRSRCSSAGSGS